MNLHATYNRIGRGYNDTRSADPFILDQVLKLLSPVPGKNYLDIGCGTGNYTIEIHKRQIKLAGMDPSLLMLETAKSKEPNIEWLKASIENTGLEPNSFDGAIATLTIHHWKNLDQAFSEVNKILQPEAPFVLFTSSPAQMESYWLNHYFPIMMRKSIEQMPGIDEIVNKAVIAGLQLEATIPYYVKNDLQDHFLYVGKNNPHLYLDENIRNGISSFSNLAYKQEVLTGLEELNKDIESGRIQQIIDAYDQESGDYLFLKFNNKK